MPEVCRRALATFSMIMLMVLSYGCGFPIPSYYSMTKN
jgi:hypothetical protein